MKVKITPTGESAQVMEFNVSLPCGANASIAPVSTLTVTQRWAKVVNVSTTGTEYVQVTKFDVIHNIQYTDCKAEMKEKSADGFVVNILNKPVRFGEDDVNQLVEIFKTFKQNN